jgi:hypothetical protein
MQKLKEFLQPNWSKFIGLFAIYLLSQLLIIPNLILGVNINILNPLNYSTNLIGADEATIMIRASTWSFLLMLNLIYQYVISCLIVFLVYKIKNIIKG